MHGALRRAVRKCTIFSLLPVLLLGACAGPDKPKSVDLGPNTPLIGVRSAWNARVGNIGFPLQMRVVGDRVYVADTNGDVAAIDSNSGGDVWRTALSTKLTAGVGSDGRYAAVVSAANEVIVLDAGREIWRQRINAVTLTAPLVAGARVFVLASDRSVSAYDAGAGTKLWQQQRPGDALVLGQSGVLLAVGDTLIAGIGGRLVGMNPQNGNIRWESPLGNSRGTNEIERLVDLVSGVSRLGNQVCARAFQSSIGCVDAVQGTLVWSKPALGAKGIDGDAVGVYGVEGDGKIVAWRRADGERLWLSDRLQNRVLSAPVVVGQSLVTGDDAGTLYFLSRQDGSLLNRISTDGSPIAATPVLVGQTLVAVTQRGGIFGFRPE